MDHDFANEDWLDLFTSFSVHHIVWDSSDHLPILVKASKDMGGAAKDVPWDAKSFKFEAKWLYVAEFTDVMKDAWVEAGRSSTGSWSEKVFCCGRILDIWGKHTFKNIHKRLRWLKKRLKRLRWIVQSY